MNKQITNNRYEAINGLRTIACLGIVLMHVKANISYSLPGDVLIRVISSFTNFVYLFMIISSFGMCCGYFDKIKNNEISPEKFYSKRINKILPFFLFLILIDVLIEHNISSLIEGFADSTLLFGLLQKKIEVIGVGWFLGLVFIFYIMFPYFTYLFGNKKRAWLTTIVSILMNLSCIYYFNVGRTNMFYSFIFFCIGGLIYLYKENIIKLFSKSRVIGLLTVAISIIIYFILPISNEYLIPLKSSLLSLSLISYAISYNSKVLNNKITKYIGEISFEIYLCHMVIFRIIEKLRLTNLFGNNLISYIFTILIAFFGSIFLSIAFKKLLPIAYGKPKKINTKGERK